MRPFRETGAVLACRMLNPKPLRGPNTGDRPSIGRAELQIAVTIDCLDADLMLFALPVHGQLDRDPGFAPAPQRAIKISQIADLRPVDRDHPVAMLDSAAAAGPSGATRRTTSWPSRSWRLAPSHGRAEDGRPSAIRSPITGSSRSIGKNILPGNPLSASPTISDPIPASLPSGAINPAPLQAGWGGAEQIASSGPITGKGLAGDHDIQQNQAEKAPNMYCAPCAKFMMLSGPKMTARASASH